MPSSSASNKKKRNASPDTSTTDKVEPPAKKANTAVQAGNNIPNPNADGILPPMPMPLMGGGTAGGMGGMFPPFMNMMNMNMNMMNMPMNNMNMNNVMPNAATNGAANNAVPPGFISLPEHHQQLQKCQQQCQQELVQAKKTVEGMYKAKLESLTAELQEAQKLATKNQARADKLQTQLDKQAERTQQMQQKHKETRQELIKLKKQHKKGGRLAASAKNATDANSKDTATFSFNQATKLLQPSDADRDDIEWNKHDKKWQQKYELLQKFKHQFGHTNCGKHTPNVNHTDDYPGLATWISTQRTAFIALKAGKKTSLTPHRIHLLNQLKFQWQPRGFDTVKFDERVPQLEIYKKEFGHCNVPQNHVSNPTGLGNWVLQMRRQYRKGELAQERIEILEAMGFQWRLRAVKVPGGKPSQQQQQQPRNDSGRKSQQQREEEDQLPEPLQPPQLDFHQQQQQQQQQHHHNPYEQPARRQYLYEP